MNDMHHLSALLSSDSSVAVSPKERMEMILQASDSKEAVRGLSTVEFYDLYHELGPSDGAVLLEYASPEQVQTCFDLDLWRNDSMSDEAMTEWTEQLLAVPDEQFAEIWNNIDPEVMALYLHRNIHLYMSEDRNDEVEIPDDESPNIAQTPDFNYWVAYPEDAEKAEVLRQLVERLYRVFDVEKAWAILEGMHWEMATDLEETAYRFRTERIRELGFVPRDESAALFARVDIAREAEAMRSATQAELYVRSYPIGEKLAASIVAYDESDSKECYFEKILSKVSDTETIRIQLLSLAQQVATYDGFQPHETDGFAESFALAVAYINIGLEYASHEEDDVAVRILRRVALKKLLTLGWNVTVEIGRKAKILISRGHLSIVEDQRMSLLTGDQRDCVEGMLCSRPRPRFSSLEPYRCMKDIQASAMCIADVATRELFFGEGLHKTRDDISLLAYSNDIVIGVENVNFDNIAITVMTRRATKRCEYWGVLAPDEVPDRATILDAISYDSLMSLFESDVPETTRVALRRYAHQLLDYVEESWPEADMRPEAQYCQALLIVEE